MKISFELLRSKSAPKSSPALSDMIRANAAAGDIKASLRMADQFNRRMLALHENIVDDFDKDRRDESELRGKLTRMYEAAMVNNLNADSPISITSGNAEKFVSVVATRSRARSAERDDVFISGAIEAYQDNVGGHEPFRLKMKVGKKNADGEFIEETETNEKNLKHAVKQKESQAEMELKLEPTAESILVECAPEPEPEIVVVKQKRLHKKRLKNETR